MKMWALLTDQGTAAGETALCGDCFDDDTTVLRGRSGQLRVRLSADENKGYAREMASQSDDTDPTADFQDCTPNDALSCCICGKDNRGIVTDE